MSRMVHDVLLMAAAAAAVFLALWSGPIPAVQAVTCDEAMTTLQPCLPFLKGSSRMPSQPCCTGLEGLAKIATTNRTAREEKRCCFKRTAPFSGVVHVRAQLMPQHCFISTLLATDESSVSANGVQSPRASPPSPSPGI